MKMYVEREYREGMRCEYCHALTDLFTFKGRVEEITVCSDCLGANALEIITREEELEIEEN